MTKNSSDTEVAGPTLYPSDFVRGYVDAMFFTEANSDNKELDGCSVLDFAPQTIIKINEDCDNFQKKATFLLFQAYDLGYTAHQAGIDFWLTRNGHGAGYWDRTELEKDGLGEHLSKLCRGSEISLCKGDDGKLYLEG